MVSIGAEDSPNGAIAIDEIVAQQNGALVRRAVHHTTGELP
jgi:hypothetical protein